MTFLNESLPFQIFNIRNDYNESVFELRNKKTVLVEYVKEQLEKLKSIHEELPNSKCLLPKIIPKINDEVEYPERTFKFDLNKENPIDFQEALHRRSMAKSFITQQEIKQHYNFLDLQSEVLDLKVKNKIESEDLNVNQLLDLSSEIFYIQNQIFFYLKFKIFSRNKN